MCEHTCHQQSEDFAARHSVWRRRDAGPQINARFFARSIRMRSHLCRLLIGGLTSAARNGAAPASSFRAVQASLASALRSVDAGVFRAPRSFSPAVLIGNTQSFACNPLAQQQQPFDTSHLEKGLSVDCTASSGSTSGQSHAVCSIRRLCHACTSPIRNVPR